MATVGGARPWTLRWAARTADNVRAFVAERQPQLWLMAFAISRAVGLATVAFRQANGLVQWAWLSTRLEVMIDSARGASKAAGGRLLHLPPYSPEFGPVEPVFAGLAALPREAGARTRSARRSAGAGALAAFAPDERGIFFGARRLRTGECGIIFETAGKAAFRSRPP